MENSGGLDPAGEGRSKEEDAVVADELEQEVFSSVCPSDLLSSETALLGGSVLRLPNILAASKERCPGMYLARDLQNLHLPAFLPVVGRPGDELCGEKNVYINGGIRIWINNVIFRC